MAYQPSLNMLLTWIYGFYPLSNVTEISIDSEFNNVLTSPHPHVINFYTPWSTDKSKIWSDYITLANNLTEIRFSRINCEHLQNVCNQANVFAFPSARFYEGTAKLKRRQPAKGKPVAFDDVEQFGVTLRSLIDNSGQNLKSKVG